jgi:excisionase family DNA binding protein
MVDALVILTSGVDPPFTFCQASLARTPPTTADATRRAGAHTRHRPDLVQDSHLFISEEVMRKNPHDELLDTRPDAHVAGGAAPAHGELPNRLLTAFEVAEFVGCHEETVRRAYLRGLLTSQRFGVRGRRFHPRDVLDWIKRGAPTRVS